MNTAIIAHTEHRRVGRGDDAGIGHERGNTGAVEHVGTLAAGQRPVAQVRGARLIFERSEIGG